MVTRKIPGEWLPNTKHMTIDLHLDLAMCALEWNRDLRLPVNVINERERHLTDKPDRGRATVSLDALRKGGIDWWWPRRSRGLWSQDPRYLDGTRRSRHGRRRRGNWHGIG